MGTKILLTKKQTQILQPLFDVAANRLGAVFGQFEEGKIGEGFFEATFIDEGKCLKIQEALGINQGKLTPDSSEVYIDIE